MSLKSMKERLKSAIDQQKIITFFYNKHHRIAEPYHYGKLIKTPNAYAINPPRKNYLLCYQIGGGSETRKMGYKAMDINKIKELSCLNKQFIIREDYKPHDPKWEREYGVCFKPSQGTYKSPIAHIDKI